MTTEKKTRPKKPPPQQKPKTKTTLAAFWILGSLLKHCGEDQFRAEIEGTVER